MTLGPQPKGGPRRAGLYAPWGESVLLPAGFSTGLELRELVRASLGGPVVWTVLGMGEFDAPGDTINIIFKPGLGQSRGFVPLGSLSSVVPIVVFPGSGIPATELVGYFRVPVPLVGAARVTITAAPVVWPHWAGCDANPAWRTGR